MDLKNSFAWLTGMKKRIFDFNEFFGSGHFFDPWELESKISLPVNHVKEFLKSVHTKAFFPELFSQNFEQLFQNSETFFQKNFWLKSLHMVTTLTGLMSSQIRQP